METPLTLTELLDISNIYVFGSALNSLDHARDLDILIVYNIDKFSPIEARSLAHGLGNSLEHYFKKIVHLVLLSDEEEQSIKFIRTEKCLRFEDWFYKNKEPSHGQSKAG